MRASLADEQAIDVTSSLGRWPLFHNALREAEGTSAADIRHVLYIGNMPNYCCHGQACSAYLGTDHDDVGHTETCGARLASHGPGVPTVRSESVEAFPSAEHVFFESVLEGMGHSQVRSPPQCRVWKEIISENGGYMSMPKPFPEPMRSWLLNNLLPKVLFRGIGMARQAWAWVKVWEWV